MGEGVDGGYTLLPTRPKRYCNPASLVFITFLQLKKYVSGEDLSPTKVQILRRRLILGIRSQEIPRSWPPSVFVTRETIVAHLSATSPIHQPALEPMFASVIFGPPGWHACESESGAFETLKFLC